jgi:hypothetical protein
MADEEEERLMKRLFEQAAEIREMTTKGPQWLKDVSKELDADLEKLSDFLAKNPPEKIDPAPPEVGGN